MTPYLEACFGGGGRIGLFVTGTSESLPDLNLRSDLSLLIVELIPPNLQVHRNVTRFTGTPSLVDLQFLVLHNPFIPPGHEMIFLKGILAGFRGDFDITAHFLVPQVEEAIRHVLQRAGHVTSKLDSTLIQEQRSLGVLLGLPETTEILRADHVFELRGILVEKFGYDLRNRLAHGFVTHHECWGADVLNLWWLLIRLLSFPVVRAGKQKSQTADSNPGGTDESAPAE
jgi:hypothetical protein